jgi:Mg-chelatase subunit ChlD
LAPAALAQVPSPGIRAGFADDNTEFGSFLDFLEKNRAQIPIPVNVGDRIVIRATDDAGKPASGAKLDITGHGGSILATRTAYADGRTLFFPSEDHRFSAGKMLIEAAWNGERATVPFDPAGPRTVEVRFVNPPGAPIAVARPALDVCFLLDATGSMDDEIARLKDTIAAVHLQISSLDPKPDIRLGLVQYRDRRDTFVTRVAPFTGRMGEFTDILRDVVAAGGGDAPEDLQEGLRVTLSEMNWRDDAIRIVFLLTDAPAQLYPDQRFTYMDAARQAAERGIKIVGIGASGLPLAGEITLRQLGAYTMGQFVFLTYGETDESGGGTRTSVSHHTGANWRTRNLDAIIVRFIRSELAALRGETLREDDWLETDPSAGADRDIVLATLFDDGVRRLLDFSLMKLEPGTPTAVLPLLTQARDMKTAAEVLENRLLLAVARHPAFRLVERRDLRQVLEEQKLSLTGAVNEADAVKVGKIVGAQLLIVPSLTPGKTKHELLLKLVRVETSEVLALSLLKIAPELTR